MQIFDVTDERFRPYGRIVNAGDLDELITNLSAVPYPPEKTQYVANTAALADTKAAHRLEQTLYGGVPTETGYCIGHNHLLNCLEFHSSSEINVAATDFVLLLGKRQDIHDDLTYDTDQLEAFLIPKGTAIEVYATTLHFAPCEAPGQDGFRCLVMLPAGTNLDLDFTVDTQDPMNRLLFKTNKWLIAHPDAHKEGAFVGLVGENLRV
ncbi:DUF4867 family protein [Levilactobacillus angrenensis]|uniref:DUF4867 family protein n=1 Tax=Levilactobacillus angrenensis TaxID=2486020 RepID=A0ABW1U6G8_9LACO|nr:DUF4867 family protein [Levilactobacillus angrenensis]